MALTVTTIHNDPKACVQVVGEVDVSNAGELRGALDEALASTATELEANLADVPYIDSTGIGVLVGAAHRAADASKTFAVTHPQRNVARVLDLLGVAKELNVHTE